MVLKNLVKKWGKIALCGVVATSGIVGTTVLSNASPVSASAFSSIGEKDISVINISAEHTMFFNDTNYDYNFKTLQLEDLSGKTFNSVLFEVGIRLNDTSKISYSSDKYKINIDNFDYGNIDFTNDLVKVSSGSTVSGSQQFTANIRLYSDTQDIFEYINNNENLFNVLFNSAKSIFDNTVDQSYGDLESIYQISSSSSHNYINVTQFANLSTGKYVTIDDVHFYGIPYFSEANPIRNLKINILNYNELLSGGYTEEDLANARQEGVDSVDPTLDNQQAIDDYIANNNMKTEAEYNAYGESQFTAGANSIDQTAIEQEGYDKGFKEGVSSVDPSADNEEAIKNHIEKEELKTKEEYEAHGKEQYDAGYKANSIWKKLGDFFTVSIPSFFKSGWNGFMGLFRK